MAEPTPMQEAITVAARSLAVADSREREIEELQAELARVKAAAEVDARIVAAILTNPSSLQSDGTSDRCPDCESDFWVDGQPCLLYGRLEQFGLAPPILNLTADQKARIVRILETMI